MLSIELTYCQPLRYGAMVAWTSQVFPGLRVIAELHDGTIERWDFLSFPFAHKELLRYHKYAWVCNKKSGDRFMVRLKDYGVRRPYRQRAKQPKMGLLLCMGANPTSKKNFGPLVWVCYNIWGFRGKIPMRQREWQTVNLDPRQAQLLNIRLHLDIALRYPYLYVHPEEPISVTGIETH